jgi:hypothetical protein
MKRLALSVLSGFACSITILLGGFFLNTSASRSLSRIGYLAFAPGDLSFMPAVHAGLIDFIYGRHEGEGPHHGFVAYASLLFWWLVSASVVYVLLLRKARKSH